MTLRWMRTEKEFTRLADWDTTGWVEDLDDEHNVGVWRNGSSQPAVIELESGTVAHDWIYAWGMFIVSERFRHLLEEFNVHAQFLPVNLIQDGHEVHQNTFFCCNLLDSVDCFDFESGSCTVWPSGNIKGIEVFRIDESKASQFHLFRLGHGRNDIILISDKLADTIKKHGLTGMDFMTIESWPEMM